MCVPFLCLLTIFHLVLWSYLMKDLTTAISHLSTTMQFILPKKTYISSPFFRTLDPICNWDYRRRNVAMFHYWWPPLKTRLIRGTDSGHVFWAEPHISLRFSWLILKGGPSESCWRVWGTTAVANPAQSVFKIWREFCLFRCEKEKRPKGALFHIRAPFSENVRNSVSNIVFIKAGEKKLVWPVMDSVLVRIFPFSHVYKIYFSDYCIVIERCFLASRSMMIFIVQCMIVPVCFSWSDQWPADPKQQYSTSCASAFR